MLAGRFVPAERAARLADGWGGDRLRALQRGDDLALVWMTAWDSPAEAREFAEGVPEIVHAARVDRRDDHVLVVVGGVPTMAAIWSRTRFAR